MRQPSGTSRARRQVGSLLLVVLWGGSALLSGAPPRERNAATQDAHQTYVVMSPAQLAEAAPELKRLKPAENQDMLPEILKRAGASVATFFDSFPNTSCTEHLVSTVQKASQFEMNRDADTYNYMAIAEKGAMLGRLREYRANAKGEIVHLEGIYTVGFVALSVNFHPVYQPDSRFRYLGREEIGHVDAYVVAFAQRPQVARQPQSADFLGKSGIVYLQGIAWIDPENFRILRLRTDIEQPEPNVGLQKETVEVRYSDVSFTRGGRTLTLPREVEVNGIVDDYVFHNRHSYSDYRLFDVQVDEKLAKP
jgi:hypothetical protein